MVGIRPFAAGAHCDRHGLHGRRLLTRRALLGLVVSIALGCSTAPTDDQPVAAEQPAGGDVLEIRLIPAGDPGPDPFTSSASVVDLQRAVEFADERRTASVDTSDDTAWVVTVESSFPGLYAASQEPVCDVADLIDSLLGDSALAAAWAEAASVDEAELEDHIAELVPVVLTSDVLVTNHGWRDSSPYAFASVLQGGSAVLVDHHGAPAVLCACGNPLAAAEVADDSILTFGHDAWDGFDPSTINVIEPDSVPLEELVVSDLVSGELGTIAIGVTLLDGILIYGSDGVMVRAPDASVTTIVDDAVVTAVDDGRGGVIFELDGGGYPSTDDPHTDAIWHLPAGRHEPEVLVEARLAARYRVADVVHLGERTLLLYTVTENAHEPYAQPDLFALDLDSGETMLVAERVAGTDFGMLSPTSNGQVLVWLLSAPGYILMDAVDTDLAEVTSPWSPPTEDPDSSECYEDPLVCPLAIEFVGRGHLVVFGYQQRGELLVAMRLELGTPGREIWSTTHVTPLSSIGQHLATFAGDQVLLSGHGLALIIDAHTGEEIERIETASSFAVLLRTPLRRPPQTS